MTDHVIELSLRVSDWKGRAEKAEAENARMREALDIIATCPPEAVHLMPLVAQAALAPSEEKGQ